MTRRYALVAGCMVALLLLGSGIGAWAQNPKDSRIQTPGPGTAPGGRSLNELEAAVKRDPRNPDLHVALGLARWDRNESEGALNAFRTAVKVGPRSAEAHNWLGVALAEKGDLPGAIALFKKAIALQPGYGRAYANLGSTLVTSGEVVEAVEIFRKAVILEPDSLAAQRNLGMALREKGDLEEALQYLRRVASSDPGKPGNHYELGQALRQSGDLSGAAGTFEKALALDPEMREGYYALGITLKQQAANARKPRPSTTGPADDIYARASSAAGRGDMKSAREQLTEALRLDDNHAAAHNLLGFVLGQQGDLASAIAHLKRATSLQPDSAEARYNLGVAFWYAGSRDQALTELREGLKLDPAAGANHAFLGTALREQGDLDGARLSLQRAIALLPPTAAVYVDLGITYLRAGDLGKALGQLETGLNASAPSFPAPDWDAAIAALRTRAKTGDRALAEAHNILGRLLGRKGAAGNEVAAAFREAIRIRPDFAEAHNHLGLVLIQTGEDEAGIASLREAVRISPDYAEARANLGAALTPTNAEAAVRELEKAVALAPASVNAQFNLAVAYGSGAKPGTAKEIQQLRKVIELAPTFARAHLALGKALLREDKISDAIAALEKASQLEPKSGEAHYQLGLALARAGRKEDATAALQKGRDLVAADDRNQRAALDVAEGRAALEKGELEEAAAKLRRAIELRPDSPEARRYLAQALEKQGEAKSRLANAAAAPVPAADDSTRVAELETFIRDSRFKEVEPLLAEYVKQRPASSWGWYALGYSLFAQQKIGESIKALAKSLELDIRNAEAHKILGRNLMIIGRFDAAQLEFEQALRYKPDSAELHYNLGKLFSVQDNWEPARKAFESALRLDPSYVEALDALGFALEALGDDAGAIQKYEKAIELNETRRGTFASAHVNLSAYYNRAGEPEKALEHARKAVVLDPKSDRAWFQKGRADERRGSLDDAVDALNQAIALNPRASSYYYVLAGVYRRLGWPDESRKALEMFKRLEQESNELDKKRRSAGTPESPPTSPGQRREQR
jgi:tetratricopeptide (TPR) repeat protein